jgi:septum formation protein
LALITRDFRVLPAHIDETPEPDERPEHYVGRLSRRKAEAVARHAAPGEPVIGADTTVSIQHALLNKPLDRADFESMMQQLSGRTHQVYSGVTVWTDRAVETEVVRTDVTFRETTAAEWRAYWETGEPVDKAGGYAIQGIGARFVVRIAGSYTNVVGLPLVEVEALLAHAT